MHYASGSGLSVGDTAEDNLHSRGRRQQMRQSEYMKRDASVRMTKESREGGYRVLGQRLGFQYLKGSQRRPYCESVILILIIFIFMREQACKWGGTDRKGEKES